MLKRKIIPLLSIGFLFLCNISYAMEPDIFKSINDQLSSFKPEHPGDEEEVAALTHEAKELEASYKDTNALLAAVERTENSITSNLHLKPHLASLATKQRQADSGLLARFLKNDYYDHQALKLCIIAENRQEILNLIQRNPRLLSSQMQGSTPLIFAISADSEPAVTTLLEHGANPSQQDKNGIPPLEWAVKMRNASIKKHIERALQKKR